MEEPLRKEFEGVISNIVNNFNFSDNVMSASIVNIDLGFTTLIHLTISTFDNDIKEDDIKRLIKKIEMKYCDALITYDVIDNKLNEYAEYESKLIILLKQKEV